MRQNTIRTALRRYRRRLPLLAAAAVVAVAAAAPNALAGSEFTPGPYWGQALKALATLQPTDLTAGTLAAPAHTGRPAQSATDEQPQPQPRKKWVTPSRYEQTTSPTVLSEQGCEAGRSHTNGIVVLAFGKSAYDGHSYGTILFSDSFAPNRSITYALEAYAVAYAHCLPQGSDAKITLVRGTSNYDPSVPSMETAGRRWSRETMVLAKYLRLHPGIGAHVQAAGGIDAEPAWDRSFRNTFAFFSGFRSARTGYLLYNFGSLDGGVGAIWTLRQAFYVAGGMKDARVVPEIYFKAQVDQWAELARLALQRYHRQVQFAGVMTQHWTGCHGCGYTAPEAHSRLGQALQDEPTTRDQARMLASVTNIN
jgi:hypothetical protein